MRETECEFRSLELGKNVKEVETKGNRLSEAFEELHCLSGDLIAKKMIHEKRLKDLADQQFTLEKELQKNLGSLWQSRLR